MPWHTLLDETRLCHTENERTTEAKEEAARRHRQLLGRRRALEAKEGEQRHQAAQALRESERAHADCLPHQVREALVSLIAC